MANNYLKALELTKKLEKKAQEATRNRRLSNQEIDETLILIKIAEELNINVDDAQKKISQAKSALGQKEYKNALQLAKESKLIVKNALNEHVLIDSQSLKSLINLSKDMESESLNEYITNKLKELEKNIILAKKFNLDVSEIEVHLNKARNLLEQKDFKNSLIIVNQNLKNVHERLYVLTNKTLSQYEEFIDKAKRYKVGMIQATFFLTKAKEALKTKDYKNLYNYLNQIKKEIKKSKYNYTVNILSIFHQRYILSRDIGVDLSKASNFFDLAKNSLKENSMDEALKYAIKGAETSNKLLAKQLPNVFMNSSSLITFIKRIGRDESDAMTFLNKAEEHYDKEEYEKAFELIDECIQLIDNTAKEEISSRLEKSNALIDVAEKLQADISWEKKLYTDSQSAFDELDYEQAFSLINQSINDVERTLKKLSRKLISQTEGKIKGIEHEYVELEDIPNLLNIAKDALKSNNFLKMYECINMIDVKIEDLKKIQMKTQLDEIKVQNVIKETIPRTQSSSEHEIGKVKDKLNDVNSDQPTVFISYSWDNPDHIFWVLNFANDLIKNGINVLIDKYDLDKFEDDLELFMELGISKSNYVIIISTPNYVQKANARTGGVGIENTIITGEYFDGKKSKYLPIIRKGEGSTRDCLPTYLKTKYCYDFRNDDRYERVFEDLIRKIYKRPGIIKPSSGKPPTLPMRELEGNIQKQLKTELSKIQDKIDKSKSLGVDTTNIDQLLSTAKRSINNGDINEAKQYISYTNERLDNLMGIRDEAQRVIREGKKVISDMSGTVDLTIVENFLIKAESLFEEGNYRDAIKYANKATERAPRLQRRNTRL